MVATPWLVVVSLLALPLWLAPPIALLLAVTRSRRLRVGLGAALIVLLTFLYAILVGWVTRPGLPMWTEGALLWGPVTLLVCGLAWLVDGQQPDGGVDRVRRGATPWLATGFGVLSLCCGAALLTPAAEFVDLRLDSPRPGMVLPLPDGLTMLSAERDCGSEQCVEVYLIGSPDAAESAEVTERLWDASDRGQRVAAAAGRRRLRAVRVVDTPRVLRVCQSRSGSADGRAPVHCLRRRGGHPNGSRGSVGGRRYGRDVVTYEDVRRVAMSLPRTELHVIRGRVKFRIKQIVYVAMSADETTMGFGFPKEEREALVASEPEKFFLPRPSDMRFHWVEAWLAALDIDEMTELVTDAWRMCVPKRVAAEHLGT
jgi:hypothetical protein